MKKTTKVLGTIGLATTLLVSMPDIKPEASASTGVVEIKGNNVKLYSDDASNARVIRKLAKGTKWKAYTQSNGYYNLGGNQWVSANPAETAYVSNSKPVTKPATVKVEKIHGVITVKAKRLNLRSDSNLQSSVVRVLTQGQSFKVYGKANGMYLLGGGVWVSASPLLTSYSTGNVVTSSPSTPQKQPTNVNTSTTSANKATQVIEYGKKFMGLKYVWGSSNPSNGGFDCSGFIYYVYKNNGYNISRTNVEGYWNMVHKTSSPKVGDLVFYQNTYRVGPSHMGIYVGDNKFLNASSSKGVTITDMDSSYWKSRFLGYGSF